MREVLLDWLICPRCREASWEMECSEPPATDGAITNGLIICDVCQARYEISGGILDLLPSPDENIRRERAGWERFLEGSGEELEDRWVLALPRLDETVCSDPGSIAHWQRQADNFDRLVDLLDLSRAERVLEIGAGRCWASAYLSRLGCQVVALDVVRAKRAGGLETGEVYLQHGTPHFDRVLASMESLPFRPQSFDLVLSLASIHHSSSLGLVAAECARVLKPGGRLALTSEPCIAMFKEKKVDNLETQAGINEHTYNILDYRRAWGGAGLKVTYFLPGALITVLEGGEPAGPRDAKSQLLGLARRAWDKAPLRRALESPLANMVGLLFFEYGLTAVAWKPIGGEPR